MIPCNLVCISAIPSRNGAILLVPFPMKLLPGPFAKELNIEQKLTIVRLDVLESTAISFFTLSHGMRNGIMRLKSVFGFQQTPLCVCVQEEEYSAGMAPPIPPENGERDKSTGGDRGRTLTVSKLKCYTRAIPTEDLCTGGNILLPTREAFLQVLLREKCRGSQAVATISLYGGTQHT